MNLRILRKSERTKYDPTKLVSNESCRRYNSRRRKTVLLNPSFTPLLEYPDVSCATFTSLKYCIYFMEIIQEIFFYHCYWSFLIAFETLFEPSMYTLCTTEDQLGTSKISGFWNRYDLGSNWKNTHWWLLSSLIRKGVGSTPSNASCLSTSIYHCKLEKEKRHKFSIKRSFYFVKTSTDVSGIQTEMVIKTLSIFKTSINRKVRQGFS